MFSNFFRICYAFGKSKANTFREEVLIIEKIQINFEFRTLIMKNIFKILPGF